MPEEEKDLQDLISVYLPQKNVTLKFPSSMSEDEIREAINKNWSKIPDERPGLLGKKVGEALTGQKAISDWSLLQTLKEIPASVAELGAQVPLWGTPGGALAMMAPKAITGIVGTLSGLGAGIKSVLHGGEFLTPALKTAKETIEKGEEITAKTVGKIPVIGKPISPAGELLHYGMAKIPEWLYSAIRKAQGEEGRKVEGSEELAKLAAGVTEVALWPLLFAGVARGYGYAKGKLDPLGSKPITVPLPKEVYNTEFKSFTEFADRVGFDLADPKQTITAKKAWQEYKTYRQYAQQHAFKTAKKAMADKELANVVGKFKRKEISEDAYELFKAFKGEQLAIDNIRNAIKDLPPEAQNAILREIEEQIGISISPAPKRAKVKERVLKEEQEYTRKIEQLQKQIDEAIATEDFERQRELQKQLEELDRRAKEKFATKPTPEEPPSKIEKIIERETPRDPKLQFIEFLKRKGYSDEQAYKLADEVYPPSEYRTPVEVPEARKPKERVVLTPEGKPARTAYYVTTPEKVTLPEEPRIKPPEYREPETPRLILPSERGFVREPTPEGPKLEPEKKLVTPEEPPKTDTKLILPEREATPEQMRQQEERPMTKKIEEEVKPPEEKAPAEVAPEREVKAPEEQTSLASADDMLGELLPPIEFQRTTPAKGTPQREKINKVLNEYYKEEDKLLSAMDKIEEELSKTSRSSKKYAQLKQKFDSLNGKLYELKRKVTSELGQDPRELATKMDLEDFTEQGTAYEQLVARYNLNLIDHETAINMLSGIIKRKYPGIDEEAVRPLALELLTYTNWKGEGLDTVLKFKLGKTEADNFRETALNQVDELQFLPPSDKKTYKLIIDAKYTKEEIVDVLNEAIKENKRFSEVAKESAIQEIEVMKDLPPAHKAKYKKAISEASTPDEISQVVSRASVVAQPEVSRAPKEAMGKPFAKLPRKQIDSEVDLEYIEAYQPRTPYANFSGELMTTKDGFVGDGTFIMKFPGGEIPTKYIPSKKRDLISEHDTNIHEIVRKFEAGSPGEIVAEIKLKELKESLAVIKSGENYYLTFAWQVDWVMNTYPSPEIIVRPFDKTNPNFEGLIEFRHNGETVGVVTSFKREASEEIFPRIERNLPTIGKKPDVSVAEKAEAIVLDEPIDNRSKYLDSLKRNQSPTPEDVAKAEKEAYGTATKPSSVKDLLKSEKGAVTFDLTTVESLKNELAKDGIHFKDLPEPVKYFGDARSIKQLRKLFILEGTLRRKFPQAVPALDILHQMQTMPRKLLHEELKATLTFYRLKHPERVFEFIESLRLQKRTRSKQPITKEELRSKGFSDREIQAIKEVDSFTHRAMDLYVREVLLNQARLDGGYTKPKNVAEAEALISELSQSGAPEHIIKQAEAIRDMHQKVDALSDQYYFPAQRYGKYFIVAKLSDGKTGYLAHVDKLNEVKQLASILKDQYPDAKITWGENYKPIYDIANEAPPFLVGILRSAIMDLEKAGALTLTGKDLLKSLDEMVTKWGVGKAGFEVHLLPAKMTPGWEKNLKRSFASYMHRLTRAVANSKLVPEFRKEMARFDIEKDFNLVDILNRYYKDLMSGRQQFIMLNRFFGVWYLGFNLKSAVINSTQPLLMTYPWSLRYIGPAKATVVFSKAYKDTVAYRTRQFHKLNPELKSIIDELVAREEVYPQATRELAGYTKAPEPTTPLWDIVQDATMIAFREAEMMNRFHAASTFYQIGKMKGLKGEELVKFIEDNIRSTQFDYSMMGLPQIARGPLRPIFIFRMFAYNWLARVKQLMSERHFKALGTLLGLHFLVGGIHGIPFMSEMFKAIHWAYNKIHDKEDAFVVDVRKVANELSEEYGDNIADFFLYGLPGVSVGVSVGGALNPLDVSMFDENQNPVYSVIRYLIGIPLDLPLKAVRAYRVWKDHGEALRAIENMAPESVRNVMVSIRWYNEQGARAPSGELIYAPSLYETIMKSLGFSPKDYAKAFERREVINKMIRERREKTTTLNEQIARALVLGNIEEVQKLYVDAITNAIKYAERGELHRVVLPDDTAIKRHMLKMLYPEIADLIQAPQVARPEVLRIESLYGGYLQEEPEEGEE